MTEKREKGRWKPGESGNPKGKPPGRGELHKLRTAIGEHIPEVICTVVAAAKGGDMQACRLLLERVLPPVKAMEPAQEIALAGATLTEQGRSVLQAIARGDIAPSQGASLLGAIATLGKVTEIDELATRVAALERKNAKR